MLPTGRSHDQSRFGEGVSIHANGLNFDMQLEKCDLGIVRFQYLKRAS